MDATKSENELHALVIYWSATGNTEKVANSIVQILAENKINLVFKKIGDAAGEELYNYDLVFIGTPSYQFLPPEPVLRFVKNQMKIHSERGDIKPCAPKIEGKRAVVFCTYSGPHTGLKEATPVGDYIGQFFEHLGFNVVAKLYILGEFHGREDLSTLGKLGDIRGRPDQHDLDDVNKVVRDLIKTQQT